MKVLVIGGAGYIGSHTLQALLREPLGPQSKIVVLDDLSTGFREALPAQVTFVEGDVRDPQKVFEILKKFEIQAVIHFAAKLIVPQSLQEPIEYYSTNVSGVISLAAACQRAGVKKIIFSSTAAVYGEVRERAPVKETYPANPINPYGSSKLMAEKILADCDLAYGLQTVVLRYFNVAGAAVDGSNGQRLPQSTHLIQVACQAAQAKRPFLEIFGQDFETPDGTGVRDYIHVEDLADLHVLALKYLMQGGRSQVLNCGYGTGFSVREVVAAAKEVSGVDFPVKVGNRRPGDPAFLVADSSRVKALFHWTPKYNDLNLIYRTAHQWELKSKN